MNIAILGYGKMGKIIEQVAQERKHTIVTTIDNDTDWKNNIALLKKADVAIEFSTPDSAINNIRRCFELNLPIIIGTTGWQNHINEIKALCINKDQALLYASNFSIGMNIFFKINKQLAQLMKQQKDYNVTIEETHHTQKLDSPSGTAITLANDILSSYQQKKTWVNTPSKKEDELPIISHRIDNITGIHKIEYSSSVDSIEITHTAKNRKGFAYGAIFAAEWIVNKKGFFTIEDMLNT